MPMHWICGVGQFTIVPFNHLNTTNVFGNWCKKNFFVKIEELFSNVFFRCQYQGMKPFKPRNERYFDVGSKLHVAFDLSYIK